MASAIGREREHNWSNFFRARWRSEILRIRKVALQSADRLANPVLDRAGGDVKCVGGFLQSESLVIVEMNAVADLRVKFVNARVEFRGEIVGDSGLVG